ncbi:hypothetical protein AAHA92_18428 [Salvia divinorum]|uniref:DUF1664 domain-containing protein n=1 Tax=Salvia divinorum TaxID=28513 RepID=A0ABD1H4V6_SALDI
MSSGKYGIVIITIVVGYGYIWWKGWKISDMMFATRRGLNDACLSVAKQLETLYSSVSVTKNVYPHEVSGNVKSIDSKFQTVHHVVRSLKLKVKLRLAG